MEPQPHVVILAGPNGAGKTTAAPELLRGAFAVDEFVNADAIARGLSAFKPEEAAIEAGRVMLHRLDELAAIRANFAFETTLASRSFVPRIRKLRKEGALFHLVFLWLPSADVAVARVAQRTATGGHHVPEDVIRRRYERGLSNFFKLYVPIANTWQLHDGSQPSGLRTIAEQIPAGERIIHQPEVWQKVWDVYGT